MRVAFGRFIFDSETRELLEGGRRLHVSPKAFDLLKLLIERSPNVVSKTELQDRIWAGAFVGDANLSVAVAEIRQALGDDAKEPAFVRTVHRVGYAFSGAASPVGGTTASSGGPYHRCWLAWHDKTFTLGDGDNVIGRDPRCTVWLDASGVSRRHANIAVTTDEVTIADLESSNGTFVGGRKVTSPRRLADHDVIELGSASLTFRIWSDDRPPKTERLVRPKRP
ncbi:MAG TPA: FHA domain-containing protein [Vicinamibacterales bacterium]|jgi:DNA-binding winged helix-turn-helix (wHTH) protein|nr:FHA domain-containing protein [Vicinamibacterales bacterium]